MSSSPGPIDVPGEGLIYVAIRIGPPPLRPVPGKSRKRTEITTPDGIGRFTEGQMHALADWLVSAGYGALGRTHFAELGMFVCPRCFMVSSNSNDLEHGYCGACHDWTAA